MTLSFTIDRDGRVSLMGFWRGERCNSRETSAMKDRRYRSYGSRTMDRGRWTMGFELSAVDSSTSPARRKICDLAIGATLRVFRTMDGGLRTIDMYPSIDRFRF